MQRLLALVAAFGAQGGQRQPDGAVVRLLRFADFGIFDIFGIFGIRVFNSGSRRRASQQTRGKANGAKAEHGVFSFRAMEIGIMNAF